MTSQVIRYVPFVSVVVIALCAMIFGWSIILGLSLVLVGIGVWDLLQTSHSLYRNYPIIGHLRELAEYVRPQIHQYFVESDTEGRPFDREQRSMVYQRSKNAVDAIPFGTERNVAADGYEWLHHSIAPLQPEAIKTRVTIGGGQCERPYSASLLNISAMSFGSLSAAAIRALNRGAAAGNFAHDTGEGGLSPYHLEFGGDIIWEIGTGYFGCRSAAGRFDPGAFKEKSRLDAVKMVEIKLSQGAKPGHGGLLPAAKVSPEIATTRGIPVGQDCASPAHHQEFSTPIELLDFVQRMRELSDGRPVGFKLCIGHRWEFLAICKAMRETGVMPDFIVIDGSEGGTGAAPVEFVDHVGSPLRDGLMFAHNALVGTGLREHIQLGASGKVVSGFDMAMCLALGANWCNSARGFMLALGCLQSQHCHTNACPVGIATQDPVRQRGLVVEQKFQRVVNFHEHTVATLCDLTAATGLSSPQDLQLQHFYRRDPAGDAEELQIRMRLQDGALLGGPVPDFWRHWWDQAQSQSFRPVG